MTAVIIGRRQLTETEEMALYELSLANELSRGKRYRWRRDTRALFQMVDDAFKSNSLDVIQKAVNFFALLPTEIQHEFLARRISPPSQEKIQAMSYRGAPLVKITEVAPKKSSTSQTNNNKVQAMTYRGAAIAQSTKAAAQPKAADTKKIGKKHVWRGVVTYED